jgi:hypothetical protein
VTTGPSLALVPPGTPSPERSYWVIHPWLLAGAYPGHADVAEHAARVEAIWRAGCRTFVSLMEEDERNNAGERFASYVGTVDELAARDGTRATCLRFAIRDVSAPSRDLMRSILDAIDLSLEAGKPVYVHCFGGVGRTGTVVGCWLIRHGLATPGDVLDVLVRLRRADTVRGNRRAPETADQIDRVTTWTG